MKFETARIHFLGDVSLSLLSLLPKLPIVVFKNTATKCFVFFAFTS